MSLISFAAAKLSVGCAVALEAFRSSVQSARFSRQAGTQASASRSTRRELEAHVRVIHSQAGALAAADPVPRGPTAMLDRDYVSPVVASTVALPLLTIARSLTLAVPVGAGLTAFAMIPLLVDGWRQITKDHRPGIDFTNSLFFSALLVTGQAAYVAFGLSVYYVSRAALVHTRQKARQRLAPLSELNGQLKFATLYPSGETVPFESLRRGNLITLCPGDIVPADSVVVSGAVFVDEHRLTGEAVERDKEPGERVLASSAVTGGSAVCRVESGWADSTAMKMAAILSKTTDKRLEIQIKAENYANRAAPIALAAGFGMLPIAGPMTALALYNSLPGKQFRLVTPFAMLSVLRQAARKGILIKDGAVLEQRRGVYTVVFDKSGTLTETAMEVGSIVVTEDLKSHDALRLAVGVQGQSDHPIAVSLRNEAAARGVSVPGFDQIAPEVGLGVRGQVDGHTVHIGGLRYMARVGVETPQSLRAAGDSFEANGASYVLLARDGIGIAAIELRPKIRAGSQELVRRLQSRGCTVAILSGDRDAPTRAIADLLGVDHWHAGLMPQDKAALIETWRQEGRSVCFVGDGVNDGMALRAATLSISLKGAAALAVDEAQVILMRPDLMGVNDFFGLLDTFAYRSRAALLSSAAVEAAGTLAVLGAGATVATTLILNNLSVWSGLAAFHGSRNTEGKKLPEDGECSPRLAATRSTDDLTR